MKFKITAIAALLACCFSCVDVDPELGSSLIPAEETLTVCRSVVPMTDIDMRLADSLSGFSSKRITIGAVRDDEYGLSKRGCFLSLMPLSDSLDFGKNPKVKRFHFAAAADSVSVVNRGDQHILQNVNVFALKKAVNAYTNYDVNSGIGDSDEFVDRSRRITDGIPVINGNDSLSFDFSLDYAKQYLGIDQAKLDDVDKYLAAFPGFYIETTSPIGNGGRINIFDLQFDFDVESGYYIPNGNYAELTVETQYEGWKERRDTSFLFYFGADDMYNIDSLLTKVKSGNFPQHSLNVTTSEKSRTLAGKAKDKIFIEGGGGLKPVVSARMLHDLAIECIQDSLRAAGRDIAEASSVTINKASLVFPFEFPDDYTQMYKFPQILSPTIRYWSGSIINRNGQTDTVRVRSFMGLTDSSVSSENQGDIDRDNLRFAPDITYHMQEIIKMKDEVLDSGNYDIWLLIKSNEITVTENENASSMNDYYQYLAYQSYYNSMYGGYGGYGGYGYGGYGGYGSYGYGNSYSNYYTYMMAAMYANSSQSTVTNSVELDADRYYNAWLNGPEQDDPSIRVPELQLVFSIQKN